MFREERKCQSLPSSPVLLRRAAEKLHQESLHGSARYCHQHQLHQQQHNLRTRSKSTVFTEAFASRLQKELQSVGQSDSEDLRATHITESQQETQGCDLCESSTSENSVTSNIHNINIDHPPPSGSHGGRRGNGHHGQSTTTATRRRMLRKLKHQSLDGDVVGLPPIQPLRNHECVAGNSRKSPSPPKCGGEQNSSDVQHVGQSLSGLSLKQDSQRAGSSMNNNLHVHNEVAEMQLNGQSSTCRSCVSGGKGQGTLLSSACKTKDKKANV